MKESLLSFLVSKLAKEKGYIMPCKRPYNLDGVVEPALYDNNCYLIENQPLYARPTQTLLQTWLRDTHQINIDIKTDCTCEPKYCFEINVFKGNPRNLAEREWGWYFHKHEPWYLYYTYESALEDALKEGLSLIGLDLPFE